MDRYQKAIEKDMVPISIIDIFSVYLIPATFAVIGIVLLVLIILRQSEFAPGQALGYAIIIIMFVIVCTYIVINLRKKFRFACLPNTLPLLSKENIILKIAEQNSWSLMKHEDCYYKFDDSNKLWKPSYDITIIYNEHGFYINALKLRSKYSAVDFGVGERKAKEIVRKIRQLAQQ